MSAAVPPTGRRLVVIYNPAKLADEQEFGGLLRDAAARHGWANEEIGRASCRERV